MRAHFQNRKRVAYLFLGSKEGMMRVLFSGKEEAFYRFATMLPIPRPFLPTIKETPCDLPTGYL